MLEDWKRAANALACGRRVEKQWQDIHANHNHATTGVLTAGVLGAHGIVNFKEKAENCLILGCYRPFTTPFQIRDSLALLNLLGIEYMRLPHENCCSLPMVLQQNSETGIKDSKARGRALQQRNLEEAQKRGAKRLIYSCSACAKVAFDNFGRNNESHRYIVDFLLDNLEQQNLEHPKTKIGYFPGCNIYGKILYPQGSLKGKRYRDFLNRINGLKITDLPIDCCRSAPKNIVKAAKDAGCQQIICPCGGCYAVIRNTAGNTIPVYSIEELLLRCFKQNRIG